MPNPLLPSGGNKRSTPSRPAAIWWVLGVLLILALAQVYLLSPAGRQISYSEFKSLVRSGQVAEVMVGDTMIRGQLKKADGPSAFTTTRIEDPKLVEELDQHGVKYSGEVVSRWLPEVLRMAGYRTLGVSANVWVTPPMGFDLGFDRFVPVGMARVTPRGAQRKRGPADLIPQGLRRRLKRTVRYAREAREGRDFGSREILKTLKPFAAGHHDRPFFCFVNVMETHAPYLPPPGFLVPTRNARVLRWCLRQGLRIVQPMTLMSVGLYNEPAGAFVPSILY